MPGGAGSVCSGSQTSSEIGAGQNEILELYEEMGEKRPPGPLTPRPSGPPPFVSVPTTGDREGTANPPGDQFLSTDLLDPPSLNGYQFDIKLIYRSNRNEAAASADWFSGSAATGLHANWNFSFLDKAEIRWTGGVPTSIRHKSSAGGMRTASPITAPAGEAGYWFRTQDGGSTFRYLSGVLERYRPDGSVTRYEMNGGYYRPSQFFDPFDNLYQYAYDSTTGRIDKVTDPRGIETRFVWNSGGTTLSVQRWKSGVHETALDEDLTFSSQGLTSYTAPSTTYRIPGTTGLLDLASAQTNRRTITFAYDSLSGNLSDITDSRKPGVTVLHVSYLYDGAAQRYRVWQQADMHGGTHTFAYSGSQQNLTTNYTDPLGNVYTLVQDADGYPVQYTVTPAASGGRPRLAAGEPETEPASLTWSMTYSCGCGRIASLTYPSGLTYNLTYDTYGNVTSWTSLSPSGTGSETYTWTYHDLDFACRPATYDPPGNGASLYFSYDSTIDGWVARSAGLWGKKPRLVSMQSSTITQADSTQQVLTSSMLFDDKGRLVKFTDVEGVQHDHFYVTSGAGAGLLQRVERQSISSAGVAETQIVQDDYGRVSSVKSGTAGSFAETLFTNDALGRTVSASTNPGNGQPVMVTEYYRDAFENVACVRSNNLDYNGQGPKYDDGTGSPRAWIRSDEIYWYDRLMDAYADRRALPDAEDLVNPTTGTNPWMVHYEINYDHNGRVVEVISPNGAKTSYVYDGYGRLYKAIGDVGGLNQDLGRSFFDNDLVPYRTRRKVRVNGAATATDAVVTFERNHNGKGAIYRGTGPDGIRVDMLYDALGQVLETKLFNAGGVLQQQSGATYDELGRVQTSRRYEVVSGSASGTPFEVDYLYNLRSQLTRIEAPLGRMAFRAYDAYGRLTSARDNLSNNPANCNEVSLEYVVGKDLVSRSLTKVFEESDDASPPAGTPKTYWTEFEYDLLGRVTKSSRKGLGGSSTPLHTTFAYNSLGSLVFMQEPHQQGATDKFSRTVFDAAGRWVQFVKQGSATEKIVLRSEHTDWQAGTKATEAKHIDGRGFVTRSQYDALYRLQNHYRPGYTSGQAHATTFQFDEATSAISRIVDGNGSQIDYVYDVAGRVTRRDVAPGTLVSTMATKEKFVYDGIGRLSQIETDGGDTGTLKIVSVDFQRDSLNRLLQESFQYYGTGGSFFNVSSSFAIDPQQPNGASDPSVRRGITYPSAMQVRTEPDALGRLEEVKLTPPGSAQFTLAKYRYAGGSVFHRQTWLGSGTSVDTSTSFDAYGRLATLQHQIGSNTPFDKWSYAWENSGDLLRKKHEVSGTTLGELFQYDKLHRLTGQKQGVPASQADGTYAAAGTFSKEITYALDAGQNRDSVTVTLAGQAQQTDYDTEANSSRYSKVGGAFPLYDGEGNMVFDGVFYYAYDFRNRISEVYTVSDAGQSAMAASTSSSSPRLSTETARRIRPEDLAAGRRDLWARAYGNLPTHVRSNAPGSSALVSRPIRVTGTPPAGSSTTSAASGEPEVELMVVAVYGYDPANRRVLRQAGGLDLRYAYDGWREVEEMQVAGGSVTDRKAFVWAHGLSEMLAYYKKTGSSWTGYYPFQDEQGSVVRLLNSTGGTVEQVEYDPYGSARFTWAGVPGQQANSIVGNPWTYAGGRLDGETGLLYLRNRYMKVDFGRFVTVDPLGGWADAANMGNPYAYGGNAASMATDKLGLDSFRSGSGGSDKISSDNNPGATGGFGLCGAGSGYGTQGGGGLGFPPPPGIGGPGGSLVGRCQGQGSGGKSHCEAMRDAIKAVAEASEDYADFLTKTRDGKILPGVGNRWRGGAVDQAFRDMKWEGQDMGYQKGPLAANGKDNIRHFVAVLTWGPDAAKIQAGIDLLEYAQSHSEQDMGEILADFTSLDAHVQIWQALREQSLLFPALSDEGWRKVRHLLWELWYKKFCDPNAGEAGAAKRDKDKQPAGK